MFRLEFLRLAVASAGPAAALAATPKK